MRWTNAVVQVLWADCESEPRNPMVGSFSGCCALAASGHVAAPPSSVMNSRRLTRSPRRRARANGARVGLFVAQIEKLIGELQEAKNLLESEGERIQREMVRYIKFAQLASASVKIIFETVSGWRKEGHPMRKFVSPARDSTGGSHMASSFDSPSDA
jgi:hypothetical protein